MTGASTPRIAVIDGCRTPFLRSGHQFVDLSTYDLGRIAVANLLHRIPIDPAIVEHIVMGRVVPDVRTSNLAREIVFGTDLPNDCVAHTVTMACVSSLQSFLDAAHSIAAGACDVAIAGGAETLSDAPLQLRRSMRKKLIASQKAKGVGDYLKLIVGLRPGDFLPEKLSISERTTGETMGENAERLAKRIGVTREEQDEFAVRSHQNAAKAEQSGLLARQIADVRLPPKFAVVDRDNGVRGDSTMEALAKLRPAFDRRTGTITAGNASFLTDGGAAVLLMSERKAEQLGLQPLAYLHTSMTVAMDPLEELLLGPALAVPRILARSGLALEEIEVVELHEAFAAQCVAVLKVLEDDGFCRERLGCDKALGRIAPERLNTWGGSLAIGHPFGATGARLITNTCHRLQHENARFGLIAACAAGALGIALILEKAA